MAPIEWDDGYYDQKKSKNTANPIDLPKEEFSMIAPDSINLSEKEVSLENIINSIAEFAHRDPKTINSESKLIEDLGLDLIDVLDLSLLLINKYKIEIEEMGYNPNINPTVQEVFAYIEKSAKKA